MQNVLLINLTRFGDLLQMQPLILGLKAKQYCVGLICLENFASATALLEGVDYVLPIPGSSYLNTLNESKQANTKFVWTLAVQQVEELINALQKDFPVDIVVNTTATLSARLLSRRIVLAQEKSEDEIPIWGFGLDEDGFGQSGDLWSTFLQGASANRLNCPFNLVDMFRSVAKVASTAPLRGLKNVSQSLQEQAQAFILERHSKPCKGYVAFQLGASENRRQWPVAHFAELGQQLWQDEQLCPILLGSPAEVHLAQEYSRLVNNHLFDAHPFIDAIGKTDLLGLAALVQKCTLIVSNDTGTMHLAAGLNVPTLAIFLATAQAFDTGPYMSNACCLEPALPCHPCVFNQPCKFKPRQPCLQSISANLVKQLVSHYLQYGNWEVRISQDAVRIWKSSYDVRGFIQLEGLSGHENEERTHWLCLQRELYRQILDEDQSPCHPLQFDSKHILGLSDNLRKEIVENLNQCTQLFLLLKENMLLLQHIPSKQNGQRILNTCTTIYNLLEKCSHLKALGHLWLVLFQERGAHVESFSSLVDFLHQTLISFTNALNDY